MLKFIDFCHILRVDFFFYQYFTHKVESIYSENEFVRLIKYSNLVVTFSIKNSNITFLLQIPLALK